MCIRLFVCAFVLDNCVYFAYYRRICDWIFSHIVKLVRAGATLEAVTCVLLSFSSVFSLYYLI